jgi:outer membrane lipoprotein LolB
MSHATVRVAPIVAALNAKAAQRRHLLSVFCASLLLIGAGGGCSHVALQPGTPPPWSGRLGLQINSEPPESFSASFELSGHAEAGMLQFFSPLGTLLATLRWQPGQANLASTQGTQTYASLDELAAAYSGGALPIAALFDWLDGHARQVEGWQVDLSRWTDGQLRAQRLAPLPAVHLRIVLDR